MSLKRTPLYDCHKECGGKFVEFGGWEMPVQYSGLVDEHHTVRQNAGLFDVSHMGEIFVSGSKAFDFLQAITSNDVSKLVDSKAQYSLLLNEEGGVVDDIIVYRLEEELYLLCVNASNADKDFDWLVKNNSQGAVLENKSSEYSQIAIQGPKAAKIAAKCFSLSEEEFSLDSFPSFTVSMKKASFSSGEFLFARTGYTGEDGFEVFCSNEDAATLWNLLLEAGQEDGLKPCGLGARDTLRLEASYPLHGHELLDDRSALESGVSWVVKFKKGDFLGSQALKSQKDKGLSSKLVGVEVLERGIVRHDTPLFSKDGDEVGLVTSGTKTPTLDKAIGIAYLKNEFSEPGTELEAEVRGRRLNVSVCKLPFYKKI